MSMNLEGTKIATASVKGTLVRVFDVQTGQLQNELRRGADTSEIFSISFNYDSTRLCVSSDKGSIHIFNLESRNRTSRFLVPPISNFLFPWLNPILPIASQCLATWSSTLDQSGALRDTTSRSPIRSVLLELGLTNTLLSVTTVFTFLLDGLVFEFSNFHCFPFPIFTVVCADGSYFKLTFDPERGGECHRETYSKFLKMTDDD